MTKSKTENQTETIQLHMITQAEFIVKLARQGYWYEDREVWELTRLIDDYVVKKYPEVDIKAMSDKVDFINKFQKKQKGDVGDD